MFAMMNVYKSVLLKVKFAFIYINILDYIKLIVL